MLTHPPNRLTILLISMVFVIAGCAPALKIAPPEDPNQLFAQASAQKNSNQIESAYRSYLRIWQRYPNHELAPESLYQAASLASRFNQAKSIDLHETFLETFPLSAHTDEIAAHLFELYMGTSMYDDARRLLIQRYSINPSKRWTALGTHLAQTLTDAGQPLDALETITVLYPSADMESRKDLRTLWSTALMQVNTVDKLIELEDTVIDRSLMEALLARQADIRQGGAPAGMPAPGIPGGITPGQSRIMKDRPYPVIGVLVPLSGRWQPIGEKIIKGIELAANVFSSAETPAVEYVVRDYSSDESRVPALIDELDREEQVFAIIGPIGEKASEASCIHAQEKGIPMISFTQAEFSPTDGSFCFRNFVSIDIQVKTLLQVASAMNHRAFAIMKPDDHFGTVFSELFTRMAPLYGIEVIRSITYSPQRVDFKEQVKSLVGIMDEPPADVQDREEKDTAIPITPDFDALLIPDTAINSAMIASYITYFNVVDVRLFGPSLWDSPDFLRVGGKHVEDAVFVSGFFLDSRIGFIQDFSDSFYYTFGYTPSVWEASAYDTAVILQNLFTGQVLDRRTLRERIASVKDYPGLTGATSFFNDGTLDKVIFVLTVRGGEVLEIQP
ncbi:MAG: ABC transporter substrate-binding protein [Desulfomonilia bacterium]